MKARILANTGKVNEGLEVYELAIKKMKNTELFMQRSICYCNSINEIVKNGLIGYEAKVEYYSSGLIEISSKE